MCTRTLILAALLLFTGITACKKTLDTSSTTGIAGITDTGRTSVNTDTTLISYPQRKLTGCPGGPDYGDSIIFLQPSSTDYIVKPLNHPDTGSYYAWPRGMVIDINTGAINVSKSEGGLRYNIGYIKKGTTDTCLQTLVLAGASYADSLYVLNSDQRYAEPYFNADPTLTSICNSSNGPGGNTCAFDINGHAASQHIFIDRNTGIIDLKKTANLAFGLIPLNGTTVTTTMYYQLNDKSSLAPQKITLDFVYYYKKSDVPADLLTLVSTKLDIILSQLLLINLPGTSNPQLKTGNPRPPIIIVTRSAL